MGFRDWWRRSPIVQKASAVSGIIVSNPGQPKWTPRDYAAFAEEGYRKNVVAYQAINKIAEAVAAVEWTAWRRDQEVTDTPFLELLRQPNPLQSRAEYLKAYVGFRLLSGNGWQERVLLGRVPRELYALRPDRMRVVPGPDGLPARYDYTVNGQTRSWDVDPVTLDSDVRHDRMFNPLDDWYGMSPIEAGAYAIDTSNEAQKLTQALLQNSARPSGALISDAPLADDQYNRLKSTLEQQYQGAGNAGRPLLLEGGLKWQQMGMTLRDLEIIETRYASARDISLAFGVPPLLLGLKGDNTFANYAEARLAFWEECVIPLCQQIAHDWTDWLGPFFGDLTIKPDFDNVPAIAEKKAVMWKMANEAPDLTVNEKRELRGYGRLPDGDAVLVPMGQVPLSEIVNPPDPPGDVDPALAFGEKAMEWKAEGHKPTESMAAEARRGLEWREEYGRGGTRIGVARARDISNRANLSADTVKRMKSYFARHEVDKQAEGWSPGEDGYPSAGRIAWALWGGDPGKSWANRIADQLEDDD